MVIYFIPGFPLKTQKKTQKNIEKQSMTTETQDVRCSLCHLKPRLCNARMNDRRLPGLMLPKKRSKLSHLLTFTLSQS